MTKKISIRNIKHIQSLDFELPSTPGVYVLTGSNGSGKTTLMTCLLRIGWERAFQDLFKTGSERVDSYDGEIKYTLANESVTYHHTGIRWPANPRRNSQLFSDWFPEVRFLPATGNRLYIHEQNINPTNFRAADNNLKADLNSLLETDKFNNLRFVQTGSARGPGGGSQRWKRAYVIRKGNSYYSEKNFSLGEILILNTLLLIQDVKNGSMLLIDELEMALHPRVQIRLLKYLTEKAREKRLTVILSTHSSSLIKCADKLIYLENNGSGEINVNTNCYPAVILKDVAIEEDIQPDYIFLVEDDMAQMLLKEILKHYFQLDATRLVPVYKILPIGGYPQLFEFADNSSGYLFSSKIGLYLFPDADVVEAKKKLATKGNSRDLPEQELFNLFRKFETRTKFLPITPELGIFNWLCSNTSNIQQSLNLHYSDVTFKLKDLIEDTAKHFPNNSDNNSDTERKQAKRKLKYLTLLLEHKTNENAKRISQFLFGLFVKDYYTKSDNIDLLKSTWGQIFHTRGNKTN